ncbi:hypothetical protein SK128_013174 [Halocaridina rubra]|uniref:Uncharacterized protein n=1 Tax=Halocaridina rubra TaxID=373956 RepID=A0AAN8WZC4_HALRR
MIARGVNITKRRFIWITLWFISVVMTIFIRDTYPGQFNLSANDVLAPDLIQLPPEEFCKGQGNYINSEEVLTGLSASSENSETNGNIAIDLGKTFAHCRCSQVPQDHRDFYVKNLNLTMPDLDMTTIEHLRKHHPNFPVSITAEIMAGRCHLMPQPHA